MGMKISKIKVWSCELDDRAGSLAEKLSPLASAGANIQFLLARRKPEQPGKGVLFLSPIQGKKQEVAARNAHFSEAHDLVCVRVEGANKSGLGFRLTETLAEAGINLRGLSASVLGRKFVLFLAFDNPADADAGTKAIRKIKK